MPAGGGYPAGDGPLAEKYASQVSRKSQTQALAQEGRNQTDAFGISRGQPNQGGDTTGYSPPPAGRMTGPGFSLTRSADGAGSLPTVLRNLMKAKALKRNRGGEDRMDVVRRFFAGRNHYNNLGGKRRP